MANIIKLKSSLLLIAGMATGAAFAAPVEINPVLKSTRTWNGISLANQMETSVLTYKIAPGGKTPVHVHPVNGSGYILSGELTMFATSDPHGSFSDPALIKKVTLKKGQAWNEAVNTWHYGENKSDREVTFILMFAGTKNTPITLSLQ